MQITSGLPEGFNAGAYDMIVVGAGYAGAVCARRLAETIGYRVAVLERRSHIAGNAYDCTDEAGILIHEYGPHIYHTFNERVHNFLSRFTKWTDYQHKVLANINGRVPVFVGDDDRYFPQAPFQGMPQEGYTALFEHMLDHDLIDVFCDVDARDLFEIDETTVKIDGKVYGGEIVYTGPLDELFNLDLGALPYRTLDMKFETLDMDQFQPVGTVNYTTSEDYTRITEFKNMTGQVLPGKTTIMKEYSKAYTPGSGETPYYAILEPENRELYERYLERVQNLTNFHPVGRLAEYRYYDMDAVTNSALDLSDEIIACHA